MISRGVKLEYGSLEESLAMTALNKRAEIEYLKTMAVVNAIICVGNQISAASTGGESGGSDKLTQTLDALRDLLLPQLKADKEKKTARAKEILAKEVAGGPIQVQVVGKGKKHGR